MVMDVQISRLSQSSRIPASIQPTCVGSAQIGPQRQTRHSHGYRGFQRTLLDFKEQTVQVFNHTIGTLAVDQGNGTAVHCEETVPVGSQI
jgi:hypothetical protein